MEAVGDMLPGSVTVAVTTQSWIGDEVARSVFAYLRSAAMGGCGIVAVGAFERWVEMGLVALVLSSISWSTDGGSWDESKGLVIV